MSNRIHVMKFGGTSVATSEARLTAAMKVISAKEKGIQPVVVVSAIGRKGMPYATDTFINLLREIDPSVEPDARELDLLIACGEILSAVVFAHTLKTLGHSSMAFRGGQAGIRTDGVLETRELSASIQRPCFRVSTQGRFQLSVDFKAFTPKTRICQVVS